ncbi:hypothetical protein [Sphingobacterium sp. UBA7038]|uniref:hypothetical protein n=1 Tax=Sphingobacterium TaxID=28453 RepID=UPI00257C9406|nr:hypothetical protein [Sphingobacterium sp. UBA7038]
MNRTTIIARSKTTDLSMRIAELFRMIPIWQGIRTTAIFGVVPPKVHVRRIWYANKFALFTVYTAH